MGYEEGGLPESTTAKISIIIIEDHTILREILAGTLEKEPDFEIVGHWDDAETALASLPVCEKPDVAVIDNMLPGMTGIAFVRQLAILQPQIKTIILSMFSREEDIFGAFDAGVKGYLPKVASIRELADAIRDVHRGERVISPKISDTFFKYCSRVNHAVKGQVALTDEQRRILEMAKEGLSNKEISDSLRLNLSTIKLRFREICKKLDARDRTQAVIEAIKLGLLSLKD